MDAPGPTRNANVARILLSLSLLLFLAYLAHLRPTRWFGLMSDDAEYFSSAKALAQGQGYIFPVLPGNPPETKYPVLYPWLLSVVWKLGPAFPSNVAVSIGLTALFACWFLVGMFELLREMKGVGHWAALAIVVLCAFDAYFVLFSGLLLSDLPFMALAITAALLGDRALRAEKPLLEAGLTGGLAGCSLLMRSIGLAVLAGVVVTGLLRRSFRQLAAFGVASVPFLATALWFMRPVQNSAVSSLQGASALPGWRQTLIYNTSYTKMWQLCVPNLHAFLMVVRGNIEQFLLMPASYLITPTLNIGDGRAMNALGTVVGVFCLAGVIRQACRDQWRTIHFIFVFYLAILIFWNYPILDRLLLLFFPLFAMGLWIEGKHLGKLVVAKLRTSGPYAERIVAGLLGAALLMLAGTLALNWIRGYRPQLESIARDRAEALRQTMPLYAWIRRHTPRDAVIVSFADARLYLYTDRHAVAPIAFSTQYAYSLDRKDFQPDLDHITDAAVAVGACYWLDAADDFEAVRFPAADARPRIAEVLTGMPEVMRSDDGSVRLYNISSLTHQSQAACALPDAGSN